MIQGPISPIDFCYGISSAVDFIDIVHVKVELIPAPKMHIIPIMRRFVWTTYFAQCDDTFLKVNTWQNKFVLFSLLHSVDFIGQDGIRKFSKFQSCLFLLCCRNLNSNRSMIGYYNDGKARKACIGFHIQRK